MLGLRGRAAGHPLCRHLVRMQVRAIFEAACDLRRRTALKVLPKVMIPLAAICHRAQAFEREIVLRRRGAKGDQAEQQHDGQVPVRHDDRDAARGDRDRRSDCQASAEFFSFGTNDLTQTTFGISRDDAETGFLTEYLASGVLQRNPFATLDQSGVGYLMRWPSNSVASAAKACRWASAANMAATRRASTSATASGWTT